MIPVALGGADGSVLLLPDGAFTSHAGSVGQPARGPSPEGRLMPSFTRALTCAARIRIAVNQSWPGKFPVEACDSAANRPRRRRTRALSRVCSGPALAGDRPEQWPRRRWAVTGDNPELRERRGIIRRSRSTEERPFAACPPGSPAFPSAASTSARRSTADARRRRAAARPPAEDALRHSGGTGSRQP